ncbi:DUF2567 domain-containing protein [Saccharopolyspora gloriosae]|uniref:DUF2567 domain-containing protein n=1 Tax=Saccharopolyspora gloriosae TaxID=455344 RepID=A0A840NSJ2_9PSEU|nr:DUF2567 domain-containing protein [Saccharopolyspora gloriosae]MBB5071177.1 hypothetical protein [Saccharopolyspora gloriosae]
MPSGTVETSETPEPAEPVRPSERAHRATRVAVRTDLLPALSTLSLVALLGLPLGWVWSRIAPPQGSVLGRAGTPVPAQIVESYHGFDALAMFLLVAFGTGLVTAAVLWTFRRRRGPVLLVAAVLGSLVSSWLAIRMGTTFAAELYPWPTGLTVGDSLTVPPEAPTAWAVVVQPMAMALGYGLAASWNGFDDLGRRS